MAIDNRATRRPKIRPLPATSACSISIDSPAKAFAVSTSTCETNVNTRSETCSGPNIPEKQATQIDDLRGTSSTLSQKYQIDRSSLRVRKRAWHEEQDDLSRILAEERQAWSKRSSKDLRTQYNTPSVKQSPQNHQTDGKWASTVQDSESTCLHGRPPKRSNFLEGSMNETSRATASVWQNSVLHESNTPKRDHYDPDDAPRQSDLDQASICSSIDIHEFKPLPPTPSTLTTTLKRIGHKLKVSDPKHSSSQPLVPAVKTENPRRKGLRKSLSSWKIFNATPSEPSDVETDYGNLTIAKPEKMFSESQQAILDERKRKAEIAYAEQFGTARKRQKHDDEPGRKSRRDPWSDTECATVRRRSDIGIASSTTRVSARLANKRPVGSGNRSTASAEPLEQPNSGACSLDSKLIPPLLPRQSSLNFDSDTDRKKTRRRSYHAIEKENQILRQQLRDIECRENKKYEMGGAQRADGQSSGSQISKAQKEFHHDLKPQLQVSQVQDMQASANHHEPNQATDRRTKDSVQRTVCSSSPGIEINGSVELVHDVPSVPFTTTVLRSPKVLSPVSLNIKHCKESSTIKRQPAASSFKQNITFEIPRSLSMVLEGVEEDENFDKGAKISSDVKHQLGEFGGNFQQVAESKSRKVEGKWDWPEDVF